MAQYIYGRNSVLDALKNDLKIKRIYLLKDSKININQKVEIKIISKVEMDKLADGNHQGIVAELSDFSYYALDSIIYEKPKRVLVLDHIQDPHNFGAILRSANAFGIKHIIIPKNRAVKVTPTVLKISSGGFVGVKIILVNSLVDAIQKLKKQDFWVYATSLENGVDINKVTFNEPSVLIVGNEQKGVSKPLLKLSDENVFINMEGSVQSLNVSVATGILLFKSK